MIKKITALILVLTMVLSITAFASFSDVEKGSEYAEAINRLVQYGILSGKGDGYFDPDAGLTRAELAKIATVVMGYEKDALPSSGTSLYSDMDGSFWASGYVNVVAKHMLILGYPNGTFAPEKGLTFAEAVTVVLRMLNYLTTDLGNNWPEAYTAKASELLLTEGMSYGDYDLISRKDIAVILDRALLTDAKSETGTVIKLIQHMDYTISGECIILATNSENKNLLSDEVSTTLGTYKLLNDSAKQYVTLKVKLVLNKDKKVASVLPIPQIGKNIIVQGIVGNEIAYTQNGVSSSLKLDDTSIVYYQGAKTTILLVKSKIEAGMTMAVYSSENGTYDYAVIKDFEMIGPIVVNSDLTGAETSIGGYTIKKEGLRVIRDGYESKLSEIKVFDVVCYNNESNILYVYCDKVSGVYEKAYPNKASISKITLSGVEYEIETQNAVKILGEYPGAYKINDYMTLLLGKDGKVVSAVNMNASDLTTYGIILSCEERLSKDEDTKGNNENFIKVFTTNGTLQEFKTDKDYTQYRGRVIKYQFSNGLLIPQFVTGNKISGKLDKEKRTIGNHWISDDAKIIDLSYSPQINESGAAQAKLIELSNITIDSLSESDVIHAQLDSKFGDVQFIILNNVTMGKYQFGVITKKSNTAYDIDIKGIEKTYQTKVHYLEAGMPVMVSLQNGSVDEIKQIVEVKTDGKLVAADGQRIKIGNTSYKLAPDAVLYLLKDFKYKSVSINDISSRSMKNIRLFADKPIGNGGLIRIIVFTE